MTRKYRTVPPLAFDADDLAELESATLDDERYLSQLAEQCVAYDRDYAVANDMHGDY